MNICQSQLRHRESRILHDREDTTKFSSLDGSVLLDHSVLLRF